jgi:hypothetical protein
VRAIAERFIVALSATTEGDDRAAGEIISIAAAIKELNITLNP